MIVNDGSGRHFALHYDYSLAKRSQHVLLYLVERALMASCDYSANMASEHED